MLGQASPPGRLDPVAGLQHAAQTPPLADTPEDRQQWRAAYDTVGKGRDFVRIHRIREVLGWSRERAIDYLGSRREVERYMALPGQALAYKIGELKITELRRRAEKRLGKRFDVRAFHTAVLSEGALPLSVLESRIERWIAERERDSKRGGAAKP